MLAGWIWRDDRLDPAFCEPIAQAACIVSSIGQQSAGQAGRSQEFAGAGEIMAVAGCDQE